MTKNKLLEKLAALEHEQWEAWATNILKTENVSQERKDRWITMFGPYDLLPEELKETDRIWARKVIDIFNSQQTNKDK